MAAEQSRKAPFIQPEIPHPNLDSEMGWASLPLTHIQWLRAAAPQLDFEVEQVVLGEIACTLRDDGNCFAGVRTDIDASEGSARKAALSGNRDIQERLTIEIEAPEVPSDVREVLRQVLEVMSRLDWTRRDQFLKAKDYWTSQVVDKLLEDSRLRAAASYYQQANDAFHPYWAEFLGG